MMLVVYLLILVALGVACAPWMYRLWRGRQAADRRARALLVELLTAAEQEQLAQAGYVEIPSPSFSHQRYRIPRRPGLVYVYEGDAPVVALCIQAVEALPADDVVLVHKLFIEGDEAEYRRRANQIRPRAARGTIWPGDSIP